MRLLPLQGPLPGGAALASAGSGGLVTMRDMALQSTI